MSLVLLALLALAALARAMPPHLEHFQPRTVNLLEALNHTVCPIEVYVDYNPKRIPRRIKMLKCAPDPNKWCDKERIPKSECCQHKHDNHQMECVQMRDEVVVQFDDGRQDHFHVFVGCSCMINNSSLAAPLKTEAS